MPRVVKSKNVANVRKPAGNPRKKNGYQMPEKIPLGEILTDAYKKQWKIGPSIGVGGFGEIYSACSVDKPKKDFKDYDHVVKIEPHGNGPLFVEMHFYTRNAKLEDIKQFCKAHKKSSVGMPHFVGHGSHDLNNQKHRFIVMPRYGRDLLSFIKENNNKIPIHTIYRIAIQMIDVYEYIHERTYVHADLKAANILMGLTKSDASNAYLVDFGLASHYTTSNFKPDPKKMHNGTLEYTSRDAHHGVPTMRGDMEILAYNLVDWTGKNLPWCQIKDPKNVQKLKEDFMKDTAKSLSSLYGKEVPGPLKNYFQYVQTLGYDTKPNYERCRQLFIDGLKSVKKSDNGELEFNALRGIKSAKSPKQAAYDESSFEIDDSTSDFESNTPLAQRIKNQRQLVNRTPSAAPLKPRTPLKEKPAITSPLNDRTSAKKTHPIRVSPRLPKNISTSSVSGVSTPPPSAPKKHGRTVLNDNITPNPKSSKTYEFNFELDVSMDANVIVNVNRKRKVPRNKYDGSETGSSHDTPEPRVNAKRVNTPSGRTKVHTSVKISPKIRK